MSLEFISGKPGGGKSLYSVRLIVDELSNGSRPVITNVALKLGELSEYLSTTYPTLNIDLFKRVYILDEDMCSRFWLHRGSTVLKDLSEDEWKRGVNPDWSDAASAGGVVYVIDEIHLYFNSRRWQETGRGCLYYLSQHRKYGDDVIAITQVVSNVDKQFRGLAQSFTYVRNYRKEKLGLFKLPGVFRRSTYTEPATGMNKPMEASVFRLDVNGLASCYDTAKGVGIQGRAADTKDKRRGLPFWAMPVGAACIALLALGFAKFAGSSVSGFIGSSFGRGKATSVSKTNPASPGFIDRTIAGFASNVKTGVSNRFGSQPPPVGSSTEPVLTGYVKFPSGGLYLTFSNGRIVRVPDGVEYTLEDSRLFIFGQWHSIVSASPSGGASYPVQSFPARQSYSPPSSVGSRFSEAEKGLRLR